MTTLRSPFLRTLSERGFIHQATDLAALDDAAATGRIVAYIGFDCTAPSLHAGSLVQIMLLRWLQKTGHKPIVLMGGGTTKVGDPSFRDESRPILSGYRIKRNKDSIKRVFSKYLSFGDGQTDAIMVDNASWLGRLNYLSFLRNFGRHFSINRMLSFESVQQRLKREQPLSFLEFNYMILQAYDFLELWRRHGCTLQMGGSDQWGNIINGVELGRRVSSATLFGLTSPLLTTSSGAKMGKTAAGAVWLNEDALSPYDYWQYWRNTEDADVGRFLRLFTELPLAEVARLESLAGSEINEAKKILATAVTTLCHGAIAASKAAETARRTFEDGSIGASLPRIGVLRIDLENGIAAFELFRRSKLATTSSDARRLIQGGGAKVNDRTITNETQLISVTDLTTDGFIKLSAGKKRHALVRPD